MLRTNGPGLVVPLLLIACSGETTEPIEAPALVETIQTSPAAAAFSIEESIAVDAPIDLIGASVEGQPVLAAGGRIYVLSGGVLEWHPLYEDDGVNVTLGTVRAIRSRVAGGAWIAGGDRLFILDDLYVLTSPIALDAGAIHDVADVAGGPLAGLWIAADDGLYRRTDSNIEAWTIPGASGAVTAIAIEQGGKFGAAIVGGQLVVLEADQGDVLTDTGVVDIGVARKLSSTAGAIWAVGEKGAVRFSTTAVPPYRLHTFGGSADSYDVATDPITGHAWVRTTDTMIEIDGATIAAYPVAMVEGQTPSMAVDRLGDVFSAADSALAKNGTGASGAGVSFDADVLPWIQARCSQCHMNQTQNFETYDVFVEVAEEALSRVRTGDMPRCTGSVRCDDGDRLTSADYAVLEQWLRDGKIQ